MGYSADYTRTAVAELVASGSVQRNGLATAALVSGLLSFFCVPFVAGIVAIVFGVVAYRELRHDRRQSGSSLALAGLILGSANVLLVVLLVATTWLEQPMATPVAKPSVTPPPIASAPHPTPRPQPRPGPGHFSEDVKVRYWQVGQLHLVDVGMEVDSLGAELKRQAERAEGSGKVLVVWVSAANCPPCNGVAAALDDARMQRALAPARVVRVNRDDFALELDALGVPVDHIPGFALLTAGRRPVDYVDGGEWDEDIADNIAPVLSKFIRGNYKQRRRPWRGGTRRDVTAL